jgi:hypothetical protein
MRDYDSISIPTSIALVAPAVRTLVVDVWAQEADDGKGWVCHHELVPVLAIQTTIEASFSRTRKQGRLDVPATVSEALRTGWLANETPHVKVDAIVVDPDYELSPANLAFDGSNVAYQIVAAPWPESEDSERLARTIKDLERRAIENASSEPRRRPAASSVPVAEPSGPPVVMPCRS